MASIVFKNIASKARDPESDQWLWITLQSNLRASIKEGLLGLLGSQSELSIKNAGLCLASIARVELSLNQWEEFLGIMESNATNDNPFHRLAAMQTLGFLSDLMEGEPLN